ncbi:MAG: thiamine biosynthesis lipoprotein [Myxococcota bacterium]
MAADNGEEAGAGIVRRLILPGLFVIGLFIMLWVRRDDGTANDHSLTGSALGTTWSVRVVGNADVSATVEQLRDAIDGALKTVDDQMSTWRDDSQLSALNRQPIDVPLAIGSDLATVLTRAREISKATDGAFDVTVGPLVAAWGFGAGKSATPPTDAALADLRKRLGYQYVVVAGRFATRTADVRIDLSAIAKGYAVDLIGKRLRTLGFDAFMVEVGGEILTSGSKGDGSAWRLGIERPEKELAARVAEQVIDVRGLALATSGDYRQFREVDGAVVSHTIDPRTGRPAAMAVTSVSVVARDCTTADAWATALMVLGPAALARAERAELAVLMLVRQSDGTTITHETESFAAIRVR